MKLATMVIFSLIIIFSISLFQNTATVNTESSEIGMPSAEGNSSIVWNFLLNPTNWNETDKFSLIGWIIAFALALGAIGVFASFLRVNVSDATAFTPAVILLVGIAAPSVVMLFGFIKGELSPIMCGGISNCLMPVWIAILFSSSSAISWVFAVIKWWRTGFTE
jgi:hypothetical protein